MSTTSEEDRVERPISEYFQASAASKLSVVHVHVGPDRKLFIFPETLLCERFKFFKSAFQSGFRESVEKAIDLPEDDSVAFSYVIDHAFKDYTAMEDKVATEEVQLALAKAYVLADKLGRPDLADQTQLHYYRRLIQDPCFVNQPLCPRAIRYVYDNTPESATLRHTLADIAVTRYIWQACFEAEWMKKWSESATSHPQFHCDIMVQLKNKTSQEDEDVAVCNSPRCIVHSRRLRLGEMN